MVIDEGDEWEKDRRYKTIEDFSPSLLALYHTLESRALYQLLPFTDGISKHFYVTSGFSSMQLYTLHLCGYD